EMIMPSNPANHPAGGSWTMTMSPPMGAKLKKTPVSRERTIPGGKERCARRFSGPESREGRADMKSKIRGGDQGRKAAKQPSVPAKLWHAHDQLCELPVRTR